jgi:hypothetical protein
MSPHLSQVLAGLYELRATGAIDLDFNPSDPRDSFDDLLLADVTDGANNRRIGFDMRDGPIIDRIALDETDVYFKRTYSNSELECLSADARAKVQPFGLNYACSTESQLRSVAFAKQLLFRQPTRSERQARRLRSLRRFVGVPVKWLGVPAVEVSASSPLRYTEFEAGADSPAEKSVIFLTRLWCPSGRATQVADRFRRLNEDRIEVIRTLRARLGDRFFGGVERNSVSEEQCPDCIIDNDTIKTTYVSQMKRHLIGIATAGLHGSIGWKLPEYIAASRCIVSQPLRQESCGLVKGKNYLPFETADECANACERLLGDSTLARAMRRHNEEYYRTELEPPVMMLKRLRSAMTMSRP